jgi:hypothetical protein
LKIDRRWIGGKEGNNILINNIITSESSEVFDSEGKEEDKLIRCLLTALVLWKGNKWSSFLSFKRLNIKRFRRRFNWIFRPKCRIPVILPGWNVIAALFLLPRGRLRRRLTGSGSLACWQRKAYIIVGLKSRDNID